MLFFFREFILFLLEVGVTSDNHWIPYFKQCTPCIANFSAVIKLDSESFPQEEMYVQNKTGLTMFGHIPRRNKGMTFHFKMLDEMNKNLGHI